MLWVVHRGISWHGRYAISACLCLLLLEVCPALALQKVAEQALRTNDRERAIEHLNRLLQAAPQSEEGLWAQARMDALLKQR